MMRSASFLFIAVLFLFAGGASSQTVTGSIGKGTALKGAATRGTIVLDIPGGLHVNSNRPASQYAIPTSVRVTARGARVGAVSYPRGRNRKFQFSENLINVYEGRVAFPFTVIVPAGFRGDILKVRAVVRYQACTEEVCYPPRSKEVIFTARAR